MPVQRSQCERDIQRLRDKLVYMSLKARAIVSASVRALVDRNSALADVLIAADKDVDRIEMTTDQLCMRILAKRQPVAKDLRTVVLCVKMVTDLERIADLGTHICEEVLQLNTEPAGEIDPELPVLGEWVDAMVDAAMTAFVQGDSQAARRVIADDKRVDECSARVLQKLLATMMQNSEEITRGRRLYTIVVHLERIGNHATNLAEMVVFMVEGRDMRSAVR